MKKLVVGTFVFVLTLMLFTNVFAETKNITEYCGNNGLLLRRGSQIEHGDVLNIKNDIKQESEVTYQIPDNYILSYGITINGGGHKLDGNGLGGFIMQQYSTGMDCDSEINDATLTNYIDDNVITVNERYTYDDFSYGLTLNNVKISSSSKNGVKAKGDLVNIKLKGCTIEDLGGNAIFTEKASLMVDNVKISSVTGYGVNVSSAVAKIKNSTIEKTGRDAIYSYGANLEIDNVKISSISGCGVSISSGNVEIENSDIKDVSGSAIHITGKNTQADVENVKIEHCSDIYVEGGYAEFENVKISSMTGEGMEITGGAEVLIVDCDIKDTYYEAFYVTGSSTATIVTTKDFTYDGGNGSYKSVDIQSSVVNFLPKGGTSVKLSSGISGSGSIVVGDGEQYTGTLVLGGESTYSGDVEMNGTTIKLLADSKYFDGSNHTVWDGTLDILNNSSDTINMSSLTGSTLKINLDVNLDNTDESDYINVSSADIEKVIINKINVSSDSVEDVTNVEVISSVVGSSTTLASSQKRVFGPIYGYDVYISSTGVPVNEQTGVSVSSGAVIPSDIKVSTTGHILTFSRAKDSYNPDILQGKVAIAGASISQEEVFDTVFNNAGNYTFFQKQGSSAGDVEDRAAPTLWVKAFGSQEDVDLEKYTKVKTTYYGAVVGLDCDRQYSDNFDATYGIFASYVGGELKDEDYGNKVNQTGGYLGVRGNWYIGKLFINGIIDYGMISNSADTSSDSNDFNSSVIGLAARLGYNFEVARRSFTIQPSVGVTGKYILTDDFETEVSSGDKFKEKVDDIQNITIEPGLKLAKNLGKCWILTGEGKYVIENVSGDVKIESEDLELVLPDMSYKNYANVGLGIEKIWGYTVLHIKGNKTFGGRDGFVINAGIEFKF